MRIAKPTLDPAHVSAALANAAHIGGGLPLSDRHLLLYAIGRGTNARAYLVHARAMTRLLPEGVVIAMVCQSDYPHALEEFGLDHWDQIVYIANRRVVLSWPIGTQPSPSTPALQ